MHSSKSSKPSKAQRLTSKSARSPTKTIHKTQKRQKHNGWKGRHLPKVVIPIITHGSDDLLVKTPTPGPYFEDPQGVEPFVGENRGANNASAHFDNSHRLIAGVQPTPFPAKIGFTRQDTLYTYARRVRNVEMKHYINALREMEEQRIERNFQIATRQANEIRDRKKIYQAWRLRKKLNTQYDHTVRMQKHAAALAASYKRGDQVRTAINLKTAQRRAKYIEILMAERRTTWIEDPDNLDPAIFNKVEHPTGWWPHDDTKQLSFSKFDTDDHDIEQYFTTTFPPFTSIRPKYDGVGEYYDVIQNGKPGWDLENEQMREEIGKHIDLDASKHQPLPVLPQPMDMPIEEPDAGKVQKVPQMQARAALRARTFILHEQMPNQLHGALRDVQSASYVEKQPYQQLFDSKDIDMPLSGPEPGNDGDFKLDRGRARQQHQESFPVSRPRGMKPLDPNQPSRHRITL